MSRIWLILLGLTLSFTLTASTPNITAKGFFSNKALLQIDGQLKLLSKGESFLGVTLLSASGRGAVVRLSNGKQIKLQLNRAVGGKYVKKQKTKVAIYPDPQGMYLVNGKINRRAVSFLVDTGATSVALSSDLAEQIGINYRDGQRGMVQTANALVPVWNLRLDSVTVGDITLRNVDAAVLEGKHPSPVLLGNSFLQHLNIQRKGQLMQLQKKY